jgi:hypothetical protein
MPFLSLPSRSGKREADIARGGGGMTGLVIPGSFEKFNYGVSRRLFAQVFQAIEVFTLHTKIH